MTRARASHRVNSATRNHRKYFCKTWRMIESICGSWAIPYLTYDSKTSYFACFRPHMTTFASKQRLNPQFSLKDIKVAILVTYRDWLSRDECSPKITGPGTAMRANATHIKCHQCGQYGHLSDIARRTKTPSLNKTTTPNGRIATERVNIVHITANVDIPRQSAVFSTNKIPLVVLSRSPTPLLVLTAAPLGALQEWRLRPLPSIHRHQPSYRLLLTLVGPPS